jgi:flavin reductase (DIM6/NTAB) family NADH-FMN oxidoreductase RutF
MGRVTIHHDHPFADPVDDPLRRFRGRLGGAVSLWTSGDGGERAGLTVSSLMVSRGEPAHVLGLLDPQSDLAHTARATGTAVVHLLQWRHRDLAEAFAGLLPSPGGLFRADERWAEWQQTEWGPLLTTASSWAGVRLQPSPQEVGWSILVDGVVEHVEVGEDDAPLVHRRGRYERPRP